MQNLNGRLDELGPIVDEFAADVMVYNFTLEEALEECITATGLFDALCDSFEDIVLRYEELLHHYEALDKASGYRRSFVLMRSGQQDIVESVWEEFEPAVPVSDHGLVFTGCGFLIFFVGFSIVLYFLDYLCCCCSFGAWRGTRQERRNIDKLTAAVTGFDDAPTVETKQDDLP